MSFVALDSRYRLLYDLSYALYDRFQHLGGIEYLEESITCNSQGLNIERSTFNLCPIGHPNHWKFLGNFATAMSSWEEWRKRSQHLFSDLMDILNIHLLSVTSPRRFEQLERMEDLEEASNVTVKHFLSDSWPSRSFTLSQWPRQCHVHSF